MEIIKLQGTDPMLYPLVGPLVMNPAVLKQNLNFPFKTTEDYLWYIALDGASVVGFIPLERRSRESVINNYYIQHSDDDVLRQLMATLLHDHMQTRSAQKACKLSVVSLNVDVDTFRELGFMPQKVWTRYVKLTLE